ncbi:hypothetical protein [Paracoccus sp. SCSIO 75233]|uniref:hypothetical protein n=1 Tax=Paracoccus sp. SCSIO 75233 TaxID=3017782 RepID=UPI0022F0CD30|nr:hypothetical protein [Paracoccus sp. SCSIO 75233]WBU53511.1 hypothetical protein PAF12_01330 [Paracoccus sp. SCSIO 75233]
MTHKSFSKLMERNHLSVVRAMGCVLTLATPDAWQRLVPILSASLTEDERALMALAALKSLPDETVAAVVDAMQEQPAGQPIPPLMGYMDEASFWADLACREELKAYALACYTRLTPADQRAFLEFVQGRAAA